MSEKEVKSFQLLFLLSFFISLLHENSKNITASQEQPKVNVFFMHLLKNNHISLTVIAHLVVSDFQFYSSIGQVSLFLTPTSPEL